MNAYIFCGGFGTRMKNFKPDTPKPLVKIYNKEIISYVIEVLVKNKIYNISLLCGYKIDLFHKFKIKFDKKNKYKIKLNILNTGYYSNTYQRLKKIENDLKKQDRFLITYGDSIAKFNLKKSNNNLDKRKSHINMLLFQKEINKGLVEVNNNKVISFREKGLLNINAGFYILSNKSLKYFSKNKSSFENEILPKIASKDKLSFTKTSFWQPIDNKLDIDNFKKILNEKDKNYY